MIKSDEAFCAYIYNMYVDELFSYGMALGATREMLEDAIQDVFLKLLSKRDSFEDVNNIKFFLFRCLKNRLFDIRKSFVDHSEIEDVEDIEFSIQVTRLDVMIEEEVEIELRAKVEHLLNSLTARQREAVYLRFMQDMEYDEIAKLLDMTPKAVRKLIYRAMDRMREEDAVLPLLIFFIFR